MEKLRLQKIGNILFFIGVVIELLIMMTDHSAITMPYRGRISHVAFALFCLKILTNHYSRREWIVIIMMGLLGVVSYFTYTDEYVIRVVVMLIAARDIDYNKFVKLILFVTVLGTTLIVLLSMFGIMGKIIDVRDYGRGVIESRWCLGFSHANNVHDMLWYIFALILLAYGEKLNWRHYLLGGVLNVGLVYLTRSRTGFITVALLVIIGCLSKYSKYIFDKIIPYLLGFIAVVLSITLSIWASAVSAKYENPPRILFFLNRIFTQRLEMDYEHANIIEWRLFPPLRSIIAVDDGITYLFYVYGIVVGIVFIYLLIYLIFNIYIKKNGVLLAVFVTAFMVMFMESTYAINTSILCNLLFVIFIYFWNRSNEQIQEQE